jgi:hypothetical protein
MSRSRKEERYENYRVDRRRVDVIKCCFICMGGFFYHFHQNPLEPVMDFTFVIPWPFAIIATPLMLLGGLIGRPKYYWMITLFSGIYCFMLIYPDVKQAIYGFQYYRPYGWSVPPEVKYGILPGLLLVIESVILFIKRNKPV